LAATNAAAFVAAKVVFGQRHLASDQWTVHQLFDDVRRINFRQPFAFDLCVSL